MKILYIGEIQPGSTCGMRMRVLQDLGHDVTGISTYASAPRRGLRSLPGRIRFKLGYPSDRAGANQEIRKRVAREHFDIVWLDKGITIRPDSLEFVRQAQPNAAIAGYSPDDMAARHCQSHYFRAGLKWYDIYFTTKTFGVAELKAMGIARVEFNGNAYSAHIHRPITITPEDRQRLGGAVGFIGDYEHPRAQSMYYLAQQGIPVRVWGPNWDKCPFNHPNLLLEKRPLWDDDYSTAINAFDINLGFLRRCNRDMQTQRSIEIPACAAFMLAERTDEHLQLFAEGREAEFFSSNQELRDKVRYYLEHAEARKRIALAGRERCISSGYSYHDRLAQIVRQIQDLRK